jgi:hypothetical protein
VRDASHLNFGGESKRMLAAAAPQPNTGCPSLPVRRAVVTARSCLAALIDKTGYV